MCHEPCTTYPGKVALGCDPYVLDFLGREDTFSEKDLEAALVRNIEKVLLELGSDICFVGRQRRLTIGSEDYYVDLVLLTGASKRWSSWI